MNPEPFNWQKCTCAADEQPCAYCAQRIQLSNDRLNERIARLKRQPKTFTEIRELCGLEDGQ